MEVDTSIILSNLKTNPDQALKMLYDQYYSYICSVIYKMINDRGATEDLAQEVFVEVWKRRESIDINTSLRGYLRKTAVNKTLNFIRAKKMKFEEENAVLNVSSSEPASQLVIEAEEMKVRINKTIESLPEKCRMVFGLSRFEELSYREISEQLGISIKTVENQVSKALKILRKSLIVQEV